MVEYYFISIFIFNFLVYVVRSREYTSNEIIQMKENELLEEIRQHLMENNDDYTTTRYFEEINNEITSHEPKHPPKIKLFRESREFPDRVLPAMMGLRLGPVDPPKLQVTVENENYGNNLRLSNNVPHRTEENKLSETRVFYKKNKNRKRKRNRKKPKTNEIELLIDPYPKPFREESDSPEKSPTIPVDSIMEQDYRIPRINLLNRRMSDFVRGTETDTNKPAHNIFIDAANFDENKITYDERTEEPPQETTVLYKIIKSKPKKRRSSRRRMKFSDSSAPRKIIEEEGKNGIVLLNLDNQPFPQFLLPPDLRQYMHDTNDEGLRSKDMLDLD